ncbi:MAG: hypothetical protein M3Y85_00440 [Bacteroidota bacterium]|nr:hypothetical protein [Bacteroidota bacterium]
MQDEKAIKILISLCQVLNKHKVRYLVVGGMAVNAHGYYRPTTDHDGNIIENPDFDFWFDPRYLNYTKLLDAFGDMGFDVVEFKEEDFPFPKSSFFRFKPQGYTLDFLPRIGGGLTFRDCYQRRIVSVIEETEISIIAIEDLIVCKKATGRKKDLEDIAFLEAKHNQ